MRGVTTSKGIIRKIKLLRSKGRSISEISNNVKKSRSIVSKYIQGVKIAPNYLGILKVKQGGSKMRSRLKWAESKQEAERRIQFLNQKEKLLILASLYWGEGTKRELNIINSDPAMLRVVVLCLKDLGIKNKKFKATLRIYEDIDKNKAIKFWSNSVKLPESCFINVNILKGKKIGKLPYGLCRIRVEKSSKYFKLIMSLIGRIKDLLP